MFGKIKDWRSCGEVEWMLFGFQSPCAGNMFGKLGIINSRNLTATLLSFQSPCAGNMFGKRYLSEARHYRGTYQVSIPVCGEHVW